MSTATSNAHDWHCEEHDTYGWHGEACRRCPEAPSEITALREQVEKLTKERDDLLIACDLHNKNGDMAEQQLAALAEQNEKAITVAVTAIKRMRAAHVPCADLVDDVEQLLKLPDLATPVLNRIRAEGMIEAEKIVRKRVQWVSNGQGIQYRSAAPESISAESLAGEIRARRKACCEKS